MCVPLSRLADCIAATKEDLQKSTLPCPLLAHAGDGNMHVCIFFDTSNEKEVAEAKELASRMTIRALEMDGMLVLRGHVLKCSLQVLFFMDAAAWFVCLLHRASGA